MLGKATDIAARIAEAHQKELERARIDDVVARGGLDGWIAQALQVLDLPQNLAPGVKKIILAESGGNPHAINLTDSNARRGTPSQGLMQTIPTTFRHYVAPQLADRPITDPVAEHHRGGQLHGQQLRHQHRGRGWPQQRRRQLHRLLTIPKEPHPVATAGA